MTDILRIYLKNGKEVFPRNGMTIPVGSMIQTSKGFQTLEQDHLYQKKNYWNNMCQSHESETKLIPIENK